MTPTKQLWLLAGGNGAGKSTFYAHYLEPLGMSFVNADVIARHLYPDSPEARSYAAARIAEEIRGDLLGQGRSFCFETVFSHPSKIDFTAEARALGYEIVLVFIHLDDVGLNKARISQRVEEGGHHVPDEKVEGRIPRALVNIKAALPLCDRVVLLDNSRSDDPFRPVCDLVDGHLKPAGAPLPRWATELLADYL